MIFHAIKAICSPKLFSSLTWKIITNGRKGQGKKKKPVFRQWHCKTIFLFQGCEIIHKTIQYTLLSMCNSLFMPQDRSHCNYSVEKHNAVAAEKTPTAAVIKKITAKQHKHTPKNRKEFYVKTSTVVSIYNCLLWQSQRSLQQNKGQ